MNLWPGHCLQCVYTHTHTYIYIIYDIHTNLFFNNDSKKLLREQEISILECFLKDHVTLKNGIMDAEKTLEE